MTVGRFQTSPFWRANDAKLLSLLAEGMPQTKIAILLGTTRAAVVQRLARIKAGTGPSLSRMQLGAAHSHAARLANTAKALTPSPTSRPAEPARPLLAPPSMTCRFPLWPDRAKPTQEFCGLPRVLGSYCLEHAKRCYQQPRSRLADSRDTPCAG